MAIIKVHAKSLYWHMKSFSVKVGDEVKAGDPIGFGDNTGFSTGDHQHFGLKPLNEDYSNLLNNGYSGAIDPAPYMPSEEMKYIIVDNKHQYLIYEPLKVAFSISDEKELVELRNRGLSGFPDSVGKSALDGYTVASNNRIAESIVEQMKAGYNLD